MLDKILSAYLESAYDKRGENVEYFELSEDLDEAEAIKELCIGRD